MNKSDIEIPEDAKWLAQDQDGDVCCYFLDERPEAGDVVFGGRLLGLSQFIFLYEGAPNPKWKATMINLETDEWDIVGGHLVNLGKKGAIVNEMWAWKMNWCSCTGKNPENDYYWKEAQEAYDKEFPSSKATKRHVHADLMIAYANNVNLEIEYFSESSNKWQSKSGYTFYEDCLYRIKPKKEIVKYKRFLYGNAQLRTQRMGIVNDSVSESKVRARSNFIRWIDTEWQEEEL